MGFKASIGDYILYLDSDQILAYSNVLQHSLSMFSNNDMLCLEEESSRIDSFLQKLIAADRKLVNKFWEKNIDPLSGFLIPRFYKDSLLDAVFKKLDIVCHMHELGINEDCLMYYHAYRLSHSSKIGLSDISPFVDPMYDAAFSLIEWFLKIISDLSKNQELKVLLQGKNFTGDFILQYSLAGMKKLLN